MAPNNGLVRPKECDWKDSNMEFIGSAIDHKVKYASALTEPAWQAEGIGSSPGLYIWRIEMFEVIPWPKERHGWFYNGDSYIILHSYGLEAAEGKEKLCHDIFFWIGAETTADEAGTAAYKTVELDEFLGGIATQHREAQKYPSAEFLEVFPGEIIIRKGGVRSGFRHFEEAEKEQILMLLRVFKTASGAGDGGIIINEVEPVWQSLDDEDVFVLDTGDKIWIWQGDKCSPMEKAKAMQVAHDLRLARHVEVEVVEQAEWKSKTIIEMLGGGEDEDVPSDGFKSPRPMTWRASASAKASKKLFRLSDTEGKMSFELVKEGDEIEHHDLDGKDVFLLHDGGKALWVWEGERASAAEKKKWLDVAQQYVQKLQDEEEEGRLIPIAKVREGFESRAFLRAISVHN